MPVEEKREFIWVCHVILDMACVYTLKSGLIMIRHCRTNKHNNIDLLTSNIVFDTDVNGSSSVRVHEL